MQIEDGIELAEDALKIQEEQEGRMLARCCLYTGIGYQMKAQVLLYNILTVNLNNSHFEILKVIQRYGKQNTNSRIDKDAANDISLKHLLRAVQLDDNDHLAFYHLALQYIYMGMLNDAMVRHCLCT